MAYGNVRTYLKPHASGEGGKGGTTIINTGGGKSNYDANLLNVTRINAANAEIGNIKASNINAENITGDYINVTDGQINSLSGGSINYENAQLSVVDSDEITTDKLTVNEDATIENIINKNLKSESITTDYLTVNKSAHFFELIIDKIKSVQGTQINTAANCVIDYVEMYFNGQTVTSPPVDTYCVYWRNKDDDDRETSNKWLEKDQAICQSFNARSGNNVANKYYWRLVSDTGTGLYVNLNKDYIWDSGRSRFSKVRASFTSWNLRLLNGFQYGTVGAQDNFNSFDIEAIGGSYNTSTKIWTPTTVQDALKIYNNEYILKNGTFIFDTGDDYAKLNVAVVYEDGSIDYNNAANYAKSYAITTATDKNISYFLITCQVIENWEACHWIDLSANDCDGTDIPEIGDNICQLGYRWDTLANPTADDKARASAIIIAAYATPDTGITPPSYAQYQNIGTLVNSSSRFNLADNRKTFFDAKGGTIIGNFKVDTGSGDVDLNDYIRSLQDSNPMKLNVTNNVNGDITMIVLQSNNSYQISDLNNWPSDIVVSVTNNNVYVDPTTLTSLNLNLFGNDPTYGRTINLMSWVSGTTTDNYNGIYVVDVLMGGQMLPYVNIQFDFNNTNIQYQTIQNTSISLEGTYVSNGDTYSFSREIPVVNVESMQGTDAKLYLLNKLNETAKVDGNKHLTVDLKYGIRHIEGITVTDVTSTNMTLLISILKSDGTTSTVTRTFDSTNHYFSYTDTSITNYYTGVVPVSYKIELKDGNNVMDSTVVNVNLGSRSLFTVEAGLTQSIQANTTAINDEINTRTNQYSSITQTVNSINSTVTQQTSNIDSINSSISSINQTVNGISLDVTNIDTDLNTFETGIQNTGINIQTGTITLNAANTEITGNLKLRAGLFYSATCVVPSSVCADLTTQTKTLIIDPSINTITTQYLPASNTYLFKNIFPLPGTADLLTNTLILPSAATYEGLEINIMLVFSDDDPEMTQKVNTYGNKLALYIKPQSGENIWAPGNGINDQWYTVDSNNFMKSTTLLTNGMKILRTYPRTSTIISGQYGSGLLAQPNYYFRLKAMGGMWYVIDGLMQ